MPITFWRILHQIKACRSHIVSIFKALAISNMSMFWESSPIPSVYRMQDYFRTDGYIRRPLLDQAINAHATVATVLFQTQRISSSIVSGCPESCGYALFSGDYATAANQVVLSSKSVMNFNARALAGVRIRHQSIICSRWWI